MGQSNVKAKHRNGQAGTTDPFSPQSGDMKVNMKLTSSLGPQGGGPMHQSPDSVLLSRVETRTVQGDDEPSSSGLVREEQAETSSRGQGLLGLHPTRGTTGTERQRTY